MKSIESPSKPVSISSDSSLLIVLTSAINTLGARTIDTHKRASATQIET